MRGFSALILIIFVGALAVGASFLLKQSNVKGARTQAETETLPGFSVLVSSNSETWELNLYGCTSESSCQLISKTGGGATELKEVRFSYSPSWSKYELLKVSVISEGFKVVGTGQNEVFVPVEKVTTAFLTSATFSDH